LRGIINSGHRKASAKVLRCVGDNYEPTPFSTWCPKAIALNGNLPSTIEDRSIVIKMRRKLANEDVSAFNFDKVIQDALPLRRKLVGWSQDNFQWLSPQQETSVPDGLNDGAKDNWSALFAIADRCGGECPDLARKVALKLSADKVDDSVGVMLHSDIKL